MGAPLPSMADLIKGAVPAGSTPSNFTMADLIAGRNLGAPAPVDNTGSFIGSALKEGGYGALGSLASGGAAVAGALGAQGLADTLQGKAAGLQQSAQESGRADINNESYFGGGVGQFLQKGGYDLVKSLPTIAGVIGGGALATAAAPAEGIGAAGIGAAGLLARGAGLLPEILGGGGLQAGAKLLPGILGGAAVTVPQAIGGNYDVASKQPGGATQGDAIRSVLQGVPVGLAQTVAPAGIGKGLAEGVSNAIGSLGSRVLSSGLANAAAGAVGSGLQAASESTFDPTLSAGDRAQQILSAAAQGGAMGGLLGSLHGFLPSHPAPTIDNISNDSPGTVVPSTLTPEAPTPEGPDLAGMQRRVEQHDPEIEAQPRTGLPDQSTRQIEGSALPPQAGLPGPDAPAPEGPAGPGPAPAPADDAVTPPVAGVDQITGLLKDNNIRIGTGGPLREIISSATDLPDLYNKISDLPLDHPATSSKRIGQLAEALGITDAQGQPRDLDTELKAAKVNGDTAAVDKLNNLLGIRDAAAAARPVPEAPVDLPTSQIPANDVDTTPTASIPKRTAVPQQRVEAPIVEDANAVQQPSPAPEAVGDRPGSRPQDGVGDTAPGEAPGAQPDRAQAEAPEAGPQAVADQSKIGRLLDSQVHGGDDAPVKSIADRVTEAAQTLAGDTGGDVPISAIRRALPDVAPKDLENALRTIHTDDTPNALTQAPAGQRAGLDGVSVPGQAGRFHNLTVEPRTDIPVERQPLPTDTTPAQDEARNKASGVEPAPAPTPQEVKAAANPNTLAKEPVLAPVKKLADPLTTDPVDRKVVSDTVAKPGEVGGFRAPSARDVADQAKTDPVQTPRGTQLPTDAIGSTPADIPGAVSTPINPIPEATPTPPKFVDAQLWPRAGVNDKSFLSPEDLRAKFTELLKGLDPAIAKRVKLIDSAADFPAYLKRAASDQKFAIEQIRGAFTRDGVLIRADKIDTADQLERLLSHEVMGHLANAERFKDPTTGTYSATAHQRVFGHIYDTMGSKQFEKIAREYGVWSPNDGGEGLGEGPNRGAGVKEYFKGADPDNLTPAMKTRMVEELIAHAGASNSVLPKDNAIRAIAGKLKDVFIKTLYKAGLKDFAMKMKSFTAADLAQWVEENRSLISRKDAPPNSFDLSATGDPNLHGIVDGTPPNTDLYSISRLNDEAGGVSRLLTNVRGGVDTAKRALYHPKEFGRSAFKVLMNVTGKRDMTQAFGKRFPEMQRNQDLDDNRTAIQARVSYHMGQANSDFVAFARKFKRAGAAVSELMRATTIRRIDPTRSWTEHTWLHDAPDAADLKAQHASLVEVANKLNQGFDGAPPGEGMRHYADVRASQKFSMLLSQAQELHDIGRLFPDAKLASYDPAVDYAGLREETRAANSALHDDLPGTVTWARNEVDSRVKAMSDFLANNVDNLSEATSSRYQQLRETVERTASTLQRLDEGPYFPLGRTGEYGVSYGLKQQGDGTHDAIALRSLNDGLANAGFDRIAIDQYNPNAKAFTRFETLDQMNTFHDLIRGPLKDFVDQSNGTFAGPIEAAGHDTYTSNRPFVEERLRNLEALHDANIAASPEDARPRMQEIKAQAMANARRAFIDTMPDNSVRTLDAHRENVQGSDSDVVPGLERAAQIRTAAIANQSGAYERASNAADMRLRAQQAKESGAKDATHLHDIVTAYQDRDAAAQVYIQNKFVQKVNDTVHTLTIAASPGYVIQNVGQIFTLGIAHLAKAHGFARSTAEITKAIPMAGRIVAAMVSEGRLLKGGINKAVLDRAGVPQDMQDHIQRLVNRAKLEFGSYAHQGSSTTDRATALTYADKALHYANSTATFSEVMSRTIMAIASKKLYDAAPEKVKRFNNAADYASDAIDSSMFRWGGSDNPKLYTQGGALGQFGPLALKFHAYPTKVIGKIALEAYHAISGGDRTPEERAESRRFMYSHLTAVALTAGTLGLPAAGWAAAALTRLSGLFNEGQDIDVQAHYRTFLASVFGKELGEVIAHGLPHYLGADLSDLGDKGLVPFEKLLADRRKIEDAWPTYVSQFVGPGGTMAVNAVVGTRDIMNGRIMVGLGKMLPTALRNVARGYELTAHGYVDSQGRKMNIDPTSADVLRQILGVENADHAEIMEKADVLAGRNEDRQYRSGVIKQNIAMALERGDQAGAQTWLQAASRYDRDPQNLGAPLTPTIPAYLAARRQAVAYSSALKTPLGTLPTDLPAMNLTKF